jgi:hypothetical protein
MGREKPLIFVSVYLVMNNNCIHMRAEGPNIRGGCTENPLEKYNNRKPNAHLILIASLPLLFAKRKHVLDYF